MKTAHFLVEHLSATPHFRNIGTQKAYAGFKRLLPPRLAKAVLFMYEKNEILFFVLNHPGLKMEFHYKMNELRGMLTLVREKIPELSHITDLKCFVSNKVIPRSPEINPTEPFYAEHSSGEFKNLAEDDEIRTRFEEIRQIICSQKN